MGIPLLAPMPPPVSPVFPPCLSIFPRVPFLSPHDPRVRPIRIRGFPMMPRAGLRLPAALAAPRTRGRGGASTIFAAVYERRERGGGGLVALKGGTAQGGALSARDGRRTGTGGSGMARRGLRGWQERDGVADIPRSSRRCFRVAPSALRLGGGDGRGWTGGPRGKRREGAGLRWAMLCRELEGRGQDEGGGGAWRPCGASLPPFL